jgi:polar amino acid transport system substrate-binding protein
MRYLLLAMLVFADSLGATPWRVAGDERFAPYSFIGAEDSPAQGLDVELINAVLREAGVTDYRIRLYPWERVKRMLNRGEVDMAFQFAGTPQRQEQYELVGPLRYGATVFMTAAASPLKDWATLADLAPYRIGQIRGYAYEQAFDNAKLSRNSNAQHPQQLVSMLLAGRIDVIVGDHLQLLHYVNEQQAQAQVRVLPTPLVSMPRFVAFAKGDLSRARQFSEALVRLRENGALERITQRWIR